jgi:hypothetical protein
VFASVLVRNVGQKLAAGVGLSGHEVKSAFSGGSYEYQYHKNTGKKKLRSDMEVCSSITGRICATWNFVTPMAAR